MFLERLRRQVKPPSASIPDGQRIYAIGDIHGMLPQLARLLALIQGDIAAHPEDDAAIIFLGDYIDRGRHSKQVLEKLASPSRLPCPIIPLMGNHEEILLNFLEDAQVLDHWRHFGGLETLISYGVDVSEVRRGRGFERARESFLRNLPPGHLQFFQSLRLWTVRGDYFFCHAGVRPGVALERQSRSDLLWLRGEFLNFGGGFEKVIVHGHTPCEEVCITPSRINVDTGAFATKRLSAVCLSGMERRILCSEGP